MCVFTSTDLFVGGGVGEANSLDLGASVSSRTGATTKTWGGVDAAHTHVTRHHCALPITETQEHTGQDVNQSGCGGLLYIFVI